MDLPFPSLRHLSLFGLGVSLLLSASCTVVTDDDDDDDDTSVSNSAPCELACLVQQGFCPSLTGAPGYAAARAGCESACLADPTVYDMSPQAYDLAAAAVCDSSGDDDDDDDDDDDSTPGGSEFSGGQLVVAHLDASNNPLCEQTYGLTGSIDWGAGIMPGIPYANGVMTMTLGTLNSDTCTTLDPAFNPSAFLPEMLTTALIPASYVRSEGLELRPAEPLSTFLDNWEAQGLLPSHVGYVDAPTLLGSGDHTLIGGWSPGWFFLLGEGNSYGGLEMLGAYFGAAVWTWNWSEPDPMSGAASFSFQLQFTVL